MRDRDRHDSREYRAVAYLQSFATQHGNAVVAELIRNNEIGQLSKMPRGGLSVRVKTEDARTRLERQEVNILGHAYKFREHDLLEDRFYIDIAGVDSDSAVPALLRHRCETPVRDQPRGAPQVRHHDRYMACLLCLLRGRLSGGLRHAK